jgi:hypothetical protein
MTDPTPAAPTMWTSFVAAIPALAVSDVRRAVAFFVEVLGFESVQAQADYGVTRRDAVEVHFWAATGPEAPAPNLGLPAPRRAACRSTASQRLTSSVRHGRWSTLVVSCATSPGAPGSSPSLILTAMR